MEEPDEYVHHVDLRDRVIDRVSRKEAHRRGLLHRAGCAVVRNRKRQFFVARRSRTKPIFPGHWDWPCSFHVAWGESYDQAAARELSEETGLQTLPEPLGSFIIDEDPDHLIVRAYLVAHNGPIRLDPREAESGEFLDPHEVEELCRTGPTTSWFEPTWALLKES